MKSLPWEERNGRLVNWISHDETPEYKFTELLEETMSDLREQAIEAQENKDTAALLEKVVVDGDLSKLTPKERLMYYSKVCESVGLNPLTNPFQYLNLKGKLVLYAGRAATDQLRRLHHISSEITATGIEDGLYIVRVRVKDHEGRTDESLAGVDLTGLKGEIKANAMMKCETKAKRRATLSLCGLGLMDETEVETIPHAIKVSPSEVHKEPTQIEKMVTAVKDYVQNEFPLEVKPRTGPLNDWIIPDGRWKGRRIGDIPLETLHEYKLEMVRKAATGTKIPAWVEELVNKISAIEMTK